MPDYDNQSSEFNGEQGGPEFDRLLRSSLETYATPGSDPDLANRVLARIAAEVEPDRTRRAHPVQRGIWWAIALPVAACLIASIAFLASKPKHPSEDRTDQARMTLPKSSTTGTLGSVANSSPAAAQRSVAARPPRRSSRAIVTAENAPLPKLDQFPAPQPLTHDEQALIAYVAHGPEAARKSLIEGQQQLDAPLTIAALEIQPLEPTEPQGN